MRDAVVILQDAAHPDVGRRLEVGAAHGLADQILGRRDAGAGVDEHEAVPEAAVQEHWDGGERRALVARHVVGADVLLADVELVLASHAPVPLARPHVGEEDEVEAVGRDGAFDQRLDDVIVATGDGESELCHSASLSSTASARNAARRGGPVR